MGAELCNFRSQGSYEKLQNELKQKPQIQKFLLRYPLIQQKFRILKKYFHQPSLYCTQINKNFIIYKQQSLIENQLKSSLSEENSFYNGLIFQQQDQTLLQKNIVHYNALYYQGQFNQIFTNVKQGKGYAVFDNGDSYEGEWKDNAFQGQGCYLSNQNDYCYEGLFKKWKKEGKGKLISKGEKQFVYEGQFKNDQMTGIGKIVYGDGGKYEGQIKNGHQEGHGVYQTKLMKYIGTWKKGLMQGSGTCFWYQKNGELHSRYTGEYLKGKKHGFGEYEQTNKRLIRGQWYEGKFRPGNNSYIIG